MKFKLWRQGSWQGSYSADDIKRMLRRGQLAGKDQIWSDEWNEGRKISEVAYFSNEVRPAVSAVAPQIEPQLYEGHFPQQKKSSLNLWIGAIIIAGFVVFIANSGSPSSASGDFPTQVTEAGDNDLGFIDLESVRDFNSETRRDVGAYTDQLKATLDSFTPQLQSSGDPTGAIGIAMRGIADNGGHAVEQMVNEHMGKFVATGRAVRLPAGTYEVDKTCYDHTGNEVTPKFVADTWNTEDGSAIYVRVHWSEKAYYIAVGRIQTDSDGHESFINGSAQ